ncbi:MAG: HlyD family efflux transporter periplasmic adaptor subunit [Dongiaceae bacterium]
MRLRTIILGAVVLAALAGGGYAIWRDQQQSASLEGIARTNGRVEATQIVISSKLPGELLEVLVREGDDVVAGQVLARVESEEIEAQLRGAIAEVARLQQSRSQALADRQRLASEVTYERNELNRIQQVYDKGFAAKDKFEEQQTRYSGATAALRAADAAIEAADAAIQTATAETERLNSLLKHHELTAPTDARVQYRLAEPGEILAAGGRVLTLLDLNDAYMTVFLPAASAGRLAIGAEARLVMDAAPEFVFPAQVSFVAADAQFTPKTVETDTERAKLMFRVKLTISPDLAHRFRAQIKPGLRGVAYVKYKADAVWPPDLEPKLPQ